MAEEIEEKPEGEKPVQTVRLYAPDRDGQSRPRGQILLGNNAAAFWFPTASFGEGPGEKALREAFASIAGIKKALDNADADDGALALQLLERFGAFARAGLACNYKPETVKEILDSGDVDLRQQEALMRAFQGETVHVNLRFKPCGEEHPT